MQVRLAGAVRRSSGASDRREHRRDRGGQAPRWQLLVGTGDAVNVAARLWSRAPGPGQVLVGERTAALVGAAFEFDEEPTTIEAKGKPKASRAARAGGAALRSPGAPAADGACVRPPSSAGSGSSRRSGGGLGPEASRSGSPRLVSVVGEAGVGKTSVVHEFRSRLRAKMSDFGSAGVCPTGAASRSGGRRTCSASRARASGVGGSTRGRVLARLVGREILGLALGLDVAGELDPRAAGQRLQEEWVRMARRARCRRTSRAGHGRTCTGRPGRCWICSTGFSTRSTAPCCSWPRRGREDPRCGPRRIGGARAALRPGGGGDARDRVLGAPPLQAPATGARHRPREGKPFFLEEVLAELIDRRLLERRNGEWALREGERHLGVPDSGAGGCWGRGSTCSRPRRRRPSRRPR